MAQEIEKRKLDRSSFSYTVSYETNGTESGTPNITRSEGYGLDISSSGIGILTDRRLSAGDIVNLFLPMGDINTIIPTTSEVRWTGVEEGRYRLGLKFLF